MRWNQLAWAAVGAAVGCTASSASQQSLPDDDPALAKRLVAEGALLLDVRSPEEFASGHIAGAAHIPIGELDRRLDEVAALAGGKDKPVVVYCRSGARSGRAKAMLLAEGYLQVTNLGSMDAWPRG